MGLVHGHLSKWRCWDLNKSLIFFSVAKNLMAYFNLQISYLGLSEQYLFEGSD